MGDLAELLGQLLVFIVVFSLAWIFVFNKGARFNNKFAKIIVAFVLLAWVIGALSS